MRPSTILRIPDGFVITEQLQTAIQPLLGEGFTIEHYSHEPNLFRSYQQRIESLFQAFDFLCEAIPPDREKQDKIQPYLDWCRQNCHFKDTWTATQYQEQLDIYTTFLVGAVSNLWDMSRSVVLLDKAEQYLLLQKPRPTIATLIQLSSNSANLALLVDKPLPPFTEETLAELKRIKLSDRAKPPLSTPNESYEAFWWGYSNSDAIREFLKEEPIDWYLFLPNVEKKLLYQTLKKIDLDDKEAVLHLSSRLRTIPGLANFAEYQTSFINPETHEIKTFETRLRSSHLGSRDLMDYPYSGKTCDLHTKRNVERLQEYINQDDPSKDYRPLLIQTLISPIPLHNPDYWLEKQRLVAAAYAKMKQDNVYSTNHPFNYARGIIYTPSDSPECLEILKATQDYLNKMRAHQHPEQEKHLQSLTELTTEYEKTLNSGSGTAWAFDYNGRELFLSSLEDILVSSIGGISYGSCVSGKDRKAIQLIHTSAILLFHEQYGYWPKYTDPELSIDRRNFVRIFTELYGSHHCQLFSGQNAPGSDGIKNPEVYLTKDIIKAINLHNLAQDDRLASNNAIEKIVSGGILSYNSPSHMMTANCLPIQNVKDLLQSLAIIVHAESFWESKTTCNVFSIAASYIPKFFKTAIKPELTATHSMPDTITKIFNILSIFPDLSAPSDDITRPIKKLADIFEVIPYRREKSVTRDKTTENFYKTLEKLIHAPNDPKTITKVFKTTMDELSVLIEEIQQFNENKKTTTEACSKSPQ